MLSTLHAHPNTSVRPIRGARAFKYPVLVRALQLEWATTAALAPAPSARVTLVAGSEPRRNSASRVVELQAIQVCKCTSYKCADVQMYKSREYRCTSYKCQSTCVQVTKCTNYQVYKLPCYKCTNYQVHKLPSRQVTCYQVYSKESEKNWGGNGYERTGSPNPGLNRAQPGSRKTEKS